MAGNIKGIIVEIGGDTSGLQKALSKVNSATSSLSKELKGVNSLLKLDPSNTELLAQKQTILSKNIEETSEKLKLLKDIQKQADDAIANGTKISEENYRALQREITNTENKLKNLQLQASKWTTAGKAIEEFGKKITNVSEKADRLGNTLTTGLTVPIVGLGTAAVTTGNNFEAQMSRVQAIASATKDELQQLTNQAIELGAETSFSATEVAEGMENLASAGFTTEEIMKAMPGLLDLAASSGTELATASEIAASAIRGFGLEADKSGHIADVFAEAAARTNAQTEDMGEAMKYIAPVANTMGISLEETAAAIGIMSDAGIKGSQAGTSLRGALTRLTKPTDKMLGIMEDLGISFYDNEGKMKSLTEMVSMLQKATKGLTDEQKQNALTILFGTESLSGMLSLINRGSDELENMTKSFKKADGAAEKMADTMLDNTAGSLESLSGSIESAGIAVQKALSPEIKKLAKQIQDLVDSFTNLSEEEQLNIIKTVALVAGIGPLIKILGTTGKALGTVTKGIGTFSQAIVVMKNNTTSSSTAVNNLANILKFIASPAGIATTAIAAVATGIAILKARVDEEMESMREATTEIENSVSARQDALDAINKQQDANLAEINNVKQLKDELSELVNENGKVKDGYEARAKFILNQLNEALGTEYKLNGDIIDSYKELQDNIDELVLKKEAQIILEASEEKYKEAIQNKTKAYEDYVKTQEQINELQEKYNKLQEDAKTGMLGTADIIIREKTYKDELDRLNTVLQEQDKQLQEYNNNIATYQQNSELMIEGGEENLKKIQQSVTMTQSNITNTANESLKQRIQDQLEANEQSKRLYDLEAKYNKDTKNNIYKTNVEEGQKNLDLLVEQLVERTNTVGELGTEETEAWKTLANNSYDEYSDALSKMTPEMRKRIEEVTGVVSNDETVKKSMQELAEYAEKGFNDNVDGKTWGQDLVALMAGGINNSHSRQIISTATSSIASIIKDILGFSVPDKGPLSNFDKSMPDMIELMTKGLNNNKYRLLNAVTRLSQDLKDKLTLNPNMNLTKLQSLQNGVASNAINSTKTIFTTPQIIFNVQELDEAKLEQCFNYINRKFGSQY